MADLSQLQEAAAAVRHSPHAVSAWEEVEGIAAELDRPDDIARLYTEVLGGAVEPQVAEMIGERAGGFCDEWFGDDPATLEKILVRVTELAPASDTALQRLSVIYTVAERWADALALYDRAVDATRDKARRVRLLREAAQLAKDVANQPDKAIGYYQRLLPLTPEDGQISQSLERLLERHERWPDLIALWESRLDGLSKRDRERSRARIAAVWLDNLGDPQRALAAAKPLLGEADDDREPTALLERILASANASRAVRDAALDLLRAHHDQAGRPREVIRVLERVIALDPGASGVLHEEAGARLAELDDLPAAMAHYAALLAMQPGSSVTAEKLRQLAERGGHHDRYADGVAAAARASQDPTRQVELLREAARTRIERLDDVDGAIALLVEATQATGAAEHEQLTVARRLAGLYAQTNRPRERLGMLERQAQLEATDAARSATLSEAAKLAESLGDTERALLLWERRIDSDPSDLSGLDARIGILGAQQRWDDLVTALESRAAKVTAPNQKRADLVQIALVHHQQRRDLAAAIAAWQRVVADNRDDEEGISALADLLAETGRWQEMADLLESSSGRSTQRTIARLVRLGEALRAHLDQPARALAAYRNAIAIAPASAEARAGLTALLDVAPTRAGAADALAQAFRVNGDLGGVLDLLPARLAEARDDRTRLALLREAAQLRLEHKHDAAGALADLARAFPLAPRDQLIENQIVSLAKTTNDWATAAQAYEQAIAALGQEIADVREAARLRMAYADIVAEHLGDRTRAGDAYAQVAAVEPGNRRAVHAFASLGAQLDRWDDAAIAVVRYCGVRETFDDELLSILELAGQASAPGSSDALAAALGKALDKHKLPSAVGALFAHRLALVQRDRRGDRPAAIAALRRALELGGERTAWLTDLVALEREHGVTAALLDALRRLADADGRDLDSLVGAADVASRLGERDQALAILSAVLGRATAAWRGTAAIRSARSIDAVARWAVDALVDLYRTGGRARAAVDTLVEAARLPFDQNTRRDMRLRAAQLATVELGDNAAAIDMYRSVLAQSPSDLEVLDRLAHLLGLEDRVPELLTLRQIQLGLEPDAEKKLGLRLELARLVGIVEERGGRLDALRANLEDRPGHEPSIEAVAELLAGKGQHRALADLLEQQAQRLETAGDTARAARLWARYAQVAETDTREVERAIAGHRRVVALAPTSDSLRALARLNLERSQPGQAVPWLESLLGTVPPGERLHVVSQLAKAHLSANQPDRAIAAIEVNLDDKEPAIELRTLLADLYRKSEAWEPLARHLTRSLPLVKDDKLARELAREASSIYLHKLSAPAKAIPALETALQLDPTDKDLRTALATGQRVAGKLTEARAALSELINDFGRRRSPERAALHVELARVAQAEGKLDEAMSEMEAASKMDVSNAAIQKELAEMARTAGQLDKAERTYRALLLVVRRQPPGDDEAAVGASEVLFELHKLAASRGEPRAGGDNDQAKELLESAMEAAIQSDAEVRRLRRSLIAHGEGELLLQVLERRLATNPDLHSQARLLGDIAETLDGQLGRHNEALDALIRAIGVMPSRTDLHERARELAKRTRQTKRFVDAVEAVVDRLRRKDDPPLIANLLMRAGEALEQDAGDLRAAANLYRRVEILGERLAEAFYAQARVAAALGDTAEQARTLDKMFELAGTDAEPTPAQVDALYRLAEIFLGSDARRRQGFDLLERAFVAEPRWAQAGRLLRQAAASDPDERVLQMYERVARNGGDAELLLDFLERRAAQPGATPAQIREAVDLAVDHGQEQRAEALLVRAVAAARDTADGLGSAPWAVLALAERRLAAGDLTQARDLTYEIAPVADADGPEAIDGLAMRIATRALAHRRVDLAADVYEFLRERSPADRAVWQPLLSIYRELGDGDRLGSVISSTLPNLVTAGERNALRLEHVRFLIENLQRYHDALDVLRDALVDDADNLEAAELYESTLRQLGDDDGIAEFLWSRFEDAQRRGHRDSTVDVALRLGDLLEKTGSPDAIRVYRAALIVAPDDREILRRVVAQLGEHDAPREGAVLMERLLSVESPERAPALAGRLATMWEAAGDMKGVQRTLELAHRSAPDDQTLHDRLEQWYRDRELWPELAELMTHDAERMSDTAAVERLREAASVYSGFLGQPLKAAEVLRKARHRAPQIPELVTDHAAALAAAGELDAAQRAIGEALATVQGAGRLSLLLLRANFRQQLGDDASAVADLTDAYELDKERGPENLVTGLERLRVRAERDGDLVTERTATLRLAQLLVATGELERGRAFLVAWIERDPRDAEPLYQLCDLDESIGHWDGVAAAATRLAYVTETEAQLTAALRAAAALTQAGRPADAVPVLELVHQHQPGASVVRDKLREVYEAAGEFRLLAGVLLADAEHGDDPAQRYANYRRAAELYLYQLEDAASAQVPAQRALELQPDDHAALMLNVDVLIQSGQLEDAGRTLETAIGAQKKRTPELAVLQQRMGKVSAALGDRDGQLNWLKKAFDVDRKNAEVAAELARLATEIGDYELALKPLRAITLMDNPAPITRPMALLWEAKIENARGNRAKAELWAKKALREDPGFSDAQQFLDDLGGS